ncbi:Mitogen-activated protein kinase kinase 5 [Phytophthora boehmeriae]|uniref:Mitogen-activated protein kinase kinase 5 n=1 Tax=Phytophthora boehmeriae TaxID=109152 RepID=A0A8T1X4P5_9STRA|nr:Mitogen-activated protein kinase kinase 5 [Phytophthora boehmeriae]
MKTRPALTVLASDQGLEAKYRGDDDDDDIMEASCDIGETTLHKAGLRINRTGVTFEAGYPDDKPYRVEEEEVVQSIVESPEPRLPETDSNGEPFTSEFHKFISLCLKKEPSERATVEDLLESSWLQLHEATNTERCIRRCAAWFDRVGLMPSEETSEIKEQHYKRNHDAKELKSKLVEDDIEIEECIETDEE